MAVTIPRLAVNAQLRAAAENSPPLSIGTRGEAVAILQQALVDLGFSMPVSTKGGQGLPDGIFGHETQETVKKFQQTNGLKPDGLAGRQTFQQLEAALIKDNQRREAQVRAERQISDPIS